MRLSATDKEFVVLLYVSCVICICPDSLSLQLLCRNWRSRRRLQNDLAYWRAICTGQLGRAVSIRQLDGDLSDHFGRPFRATLFERESSSSGFVLDCRVPLRVSGCCVGLISFAASAATHDNYSLTTCVFHQQLFHICRAMTTSSIRGHLDRLFTLTSTCYALQLLDLRAALLKLNL